MNKYTAILFAFLRTIRHRRDFGWSESECTCAKIRIWILEEFGSTKGHRILKHSHLNNELTCMAENCGQVFFATSSDVPVCPHHWDLMMDDGCDDPIHYYGL